MFCYPVSAKVNISTLLTTPGLNKEGLPVVFQKEFSLSKDRGVQYYVEWLEDNKSHDLVVKWFDSQEKLINFLRIDKFPKNIVRDYINFSTKQGTQIFIPDRVGEYSIYLYIDNKLIAITRFEVRK